MEILQSTRRSAAEVVGVPRSLLDFRPEGIEARQETEGAIYELQTSLALVSTLLLEAGEVRIDTAAAGMARWNVSNTLQRPQAGPELGEKIGQGREPICH